MKEKPILMNAFSIQQILAGAKLQTRRVIRPQPVGADCWTYYQGAFYPNKFGADPPILCCPYGKIGDHLWVREAWQITQLDAPNGHLEFPNILYRATSSTKLLIDERVWKYNRPNGSGWRPSIHMPKWASRITLEITDVRVQRIQDIGPEDAIREGYPFDAPPAENRETYIDWLHDLWDSINAKRGHSWVQNPWVWCISFSVLNKEEA